MHQLTAHQINPLEQLVENFGPARFGIHAADAIHIAARLSLGIEARVAPIVAADERVLADFDH